MSKKCGKCSYDLPTTSEYFGKDKTRKDGLYPTCKACIKFHKKPMTSEQRVHHAIKSYERTVRLKLEVFQHYSEGTPKCVCCDEEEIVFLALDHINGDGGKHREEINQRGKGYWDWLRRNNYPDGYRILCNNCNMAIRWGKICPHQRKQET